MESSWRDFGCPKPFQSSCKFHEHEALFQLSTLHERSGLLLDRVNRIDMLGVFNALSFSLLDYAIEYRVILFMVLSSRRHIPHFNWCTAPLCGASLNDTYGEALAGLRQRISGQQCDEFGRPGRRRVWPEWPEFRRAVGVPQIARIGSRRTRGLKEMDASVRACP
jgi:hypothetical protein